MHDPKAFVDPHKYEPERYLNLKDANGRLDNTVRSPEAAAFGFGRRWVAVVVAIVSLRTWFRSLIAFLFFFVSFFFLGGGEFRVCPGRYLADTSLYVAVSNVLAIYNIKPPTDDEGNEVKLRAEVTNGVLSSVDLLIWDQTWSCFLTDRILGIWCLLNAWLNLGRVLRWRWFRVKFDKRNGFFWYFYAMCHAYLPNLRAFHRSLPLSRLRKFWQSRRR